jgi:GDP-L-fucose synthase
MRKDAKIFLAGHTGLAGSALLRRLQGSGYENLILATHDELDLLDQTKTSRFLEEQRPELVILAAAKVGGIQANRSMPATFISNNIAIQTNVIEGAYQAGVEKLLFLGSSCIYPKNCLQPMKESYLLTGPLEFTNRPYAIAKIAGIEMCWAYNRQFGTRYLAVMPPNLYGVGDNYNLETSHVLQALIRRAHEGKVSGANVITAWGTGRPKREFLFSDDFADACFFLLNRLEENEVELIRDEYPPIVNIGPEVDLTIADLVGVVCNVVGFQGRIEWDSSKPDGTPRKLLDSSRMSSLGWKSTTDLRDGIEVAYDDFLAQLYQKSE